MRFGRKIESLVEVRRVSSGTFCGEIFLGFCTRPRPESEAKHPKYTGVSHLESIEHPVEYGEWGGIYG